MLSENIQLYYLSVIVCGYVDRSGLQHDSRAKKLGPLLNTTRPFSNTQPTPKISGHYQNQERPLKHVGRNIMVFELLYNNQPLYSVI